MFDAAYEALLGTYARSSEPVTVNFRKLVPLHSGVDRATHLMHSYPAKLLVNIPLFFLNCSQLNAPRGAVLDPFCGTGTVLLEGLLAGARVLGADSNPLARHIARAKVTPLGGREILRAYQEIRERAAAQKAVDFSPVVDAARWFRPHVREELGRILAGIRTIADEDMRRFMEVCFSSCVRKASLADPRLSVPVRRKDIDVLSSERVSATDLFDRAVTINGSRVNRLRHIDRRLLSDIQIFDDARSPILSDAVSSQDVALIITSPPYAGAQKYIRASSLSIGWLGLAPNDKLRNLERANIGREHFSKADYERCRETVVPKARGILDCVRRTNPLRAHIAATYLAELQAAFGSLVSRLRDGGHLVLVIGDNSICGQPFTTSLYVRELLEMLGLKVQLELVDDIRSRGLMTRRNKTAGMISREHIYVFQK